ncbi:hypothetical protein I7I50_00083 [Histoplasma capsulatum G186AR]|uniref:Uncharacterized protein n=1 Tax=Ajellomyces capsulatus TaxID=5037 RepID=A0A8H8CUK2_AJECA|nr:hypothetical protein I7I52_07352 [Histoplasma capsulatum]QSS72284.1 hypothetical protein I7I50_00083 [Histoplasma capsulatum G186AR]
MVLYWRVFSPLNFVYFIYMYRLSYFLIGQPAMDAVARLAERKMNGLVLNFCFLFLSKRRTFSSAWFPTMQGP